MKRLSIIRTFGKIAALAGIFCLVFFFAPAPRAHADAASDAIAQIQQTIDAKKAEIAAKQAEIQANPTNQNLIATDNAIIGADQTIVNTYGPNAIAGINTNSANAQTLLDGFNAQVKNTTKKALDTQETCDPRPWSAGSFSITKCLLDGATFLAEQLLTLAGYVLWLSGVSFQVALRITLGIRYLIASTNGAGIRAAWAALRDLANLVFIFAMLYMSIETILDRPNNYKKLLKPLIIAAVFINFSFFIGGIIIDASNIFAVGIYDAIMPTAPLDTSSDIFSITKDTGGLTVSGQFLGLLNLNQLYSARGVSGSDSTTLALRPDTGVSGVNKFISIILGTIIILVASFVFMTGAVLLVIRTGTLMFVLAVSPMAFAGEVVPKLENQSKKWWTMLWNQSFFAPAFLLCIYVSLVILKSLKVQSLSQHAGAIGLIFGDALVIFFLLASMEVAKEFGAVGLDIAKKVGGFVPNLIRQQVTNVAAATGRTAVAAVAAPVAAVGRNVIGKGLSKVGQNKYVATALGNTIASKIAKTGQEASFDLRNIETINPKGKLLGKGGSGFVKKQEEYEKEKVAQEKVLNLDKDTSAKLDEKRKIAETVKDKNGKDHAERKKDAGEAVVKDIDAGTNASFNAKKKEIEDELEKTKIKLEAESAATAALAATNKASLDDKDREINLARTVGDGAKLIRDADAAAAKAKQKKEEVAAQDKEIGDTEEEIQGHEKRAADNTLPEAAKEEAKKLAEAQREILKQKVAKKEDLGRESQELENRRKAAEESAKEARMKLEGLATQRETIVQQSRELEKEKQRIEKEKKEAPKNAEKKTSSAKEEIKKAAEDEIQKKFDEEFPSAKIEAAKRLRAFAAREQKFGTLNNMNPVHEGPGYDLVQSELTKGQRILSLPKNLAGIVGTFGGFRGRGAQANIVEKLRKEAEKKVKGKSDEEELAELAAKIEKKKEKEKKAEKGEKDEDEKPEKEDKGDKGGDKKEE